MDMIADRLPPTRKRVRDHSPDAVNAARDREIDRSVARHADADPRAIDRRLHVLDREWDMERTLEANAATLTLAGLALGLAVDRRFLALPVLVQSFLLQHALQGWCPPVPLFRRLGVRTMDEIERERARLLAIRGEYDDLVHTDGGANPA